MKNKQSLRRAGSIGFRASSGIRGIRAALAVSAASLLAIGSLQAANSTWLGNTDTDWATPANWTAGTAPATGDSLTFGVAGTSGATLSNTLTNSGFTIAGITFSSGASAYTMSGNAFTLTTGITNSSTALQAINESIALSGANTFTTTAGGGDITAGGALSGGGNLTTSGPGTVTLSGANTFTGTTTVNGGTLVLTGTHNAGNAGGYTIAAGATINALNGFLYDTGSYSSKVTTVNGTLLVATMDYGTASWGNAATNNVYLQIGDGGKVVLTGTSATASRVFQVKGFGATGTFEVTDGQNVTLSNPGYAINAASGGGAGSALALQVDGTSTLNISSSIGTGLAVNKTGTGTLILSGTNDRTTAARNTSVSQGTLQVGNGGTTGTLVGANGPGIAAGATLAYDRSDAIAEGKAITGAGTLVQMGGGTLTLSATNTYNGNTVVSAGTLALASTGHLAFTIGTNGVNNGISGAGTLSLDGTFDFDLSGASSNPLDSWTIVGNSLTTSYGNDFTVSGFTNSGGVWTNGNYQFSQVTGQLMVIPEPSTVALAMIFGIGMLFFFRRRRIA